MSEEKYGITDAHYLCDSAIFNTETNEILRFYQICEILNKQDIKLADLEAKLAEYERERLNCSQIETGMSLCIIQKSEIAQLKQQLAEKDRNNLLLYSMLYKTLENQDAENVSSRIDQMTGETLEKQSEWFKTNRVCDELQKQLAEKEKEIEDLKNQLKGACQKYHAKCEYLQQQIKDFSIQQLERVKGKFGYKHNSQLMVSSKLLVDHIDKIINELEGESCGHK